jgi:hypothetical protein
VTSCSKEIVQRLVESIDGDVTISHLQPGQFAVLIKGSTHHAVRAAVQSLATVGAPIHPPSGSVTLQASVGICAARSGSEDSEELVARLILVEHEVAFLDWALATQGPPALDLAVFLTGSTAHVQPSREELIDAFVAGSPTTSERAMDLALLAGLADLGWNKALDAAEHSDAEMREHARADLEWWVRRGSLGLEWL